MDDSPGLSPLELAAIAGDRDALARVLVQHSGPIARRLKSRIDMNPFADFSVEDVLQEIFLDAFRSIGTFSTASGSSFSAWLSKIADNRLASMFRDRSRLKRGGGRRQVSSIPASLQSSVMMLVQLIAEGDEPTASACLARQEVIAAVRNGLNELPFDQRQALEAHFLEGQSVDSTADEMQRTTGAVRGLIYRAKQSLRTALGESSRWFHRK